MKPRQYDAARNELGWTHAKVARIWNRNLRTVFRYASGDKDWPIPPELARLLRLLVRLRFTVSKREFESIMEEMEKET